MERRLAAILFADIVGYTRQMQADEAATLARVQACWDRLAIPLVQAHKGRIVKRLGDGLLVEFASAVNAVECAAAWQAAMAAPEWTDGGAGGEPLRFRIGVNVGDIVVDGDDILGDGVNVASRLEGLAEPGGIVVSGSAHDQVDGKIAARFVALGPTELRNVEHPVRVFRMLLPGEGTADLPLRAPADAASAAAVTASRAAPRWRIALPLALAGIIVVLALMLWKPWSDGDAAAPAVVRSGPATAEGADRADRAPVATEPGRTAEGTGDSAKDGGAGKGLVGSTLDSLKKIAPVGDGSSAPTTDCAPNDAGQGAAVQLDCNR
ncbi:adenylate/guanylate cyclase domain-containing protein [Oceanibacterium hippocampi]|uniref:Adenylate and Guanylate cyclase catalytic domain protein n=1 Tax=Oceanibacterium hippocampi TaxID=745714 RepID=A0A1Y5S389_9PROT|nr:adenylate/guanylate cyclase domain-containing protein [Oceanibacterium hippocampi]SLN31618.1 Adenylate and Guanylate cyclase catalytic domain protein [Oceanibacterium hippocampi]